MRFSVQSYPEIDLASAPQFLRGSEYLNPWMFAVAPAKFRAGQEGVSRGHSQVSLPRSGLCSTKQELALPYAIPHHGVTSPNILMNGMAQCSERKRAKA